MSKPGFYAAAFLVGSSVFSFGPSAFAQSVNTQQTNLPSPIRLPTGPQLNNPNQVDETTTNSTQPAPLTAAEQRQLLIETRVGQQNAQRATAAGQVTDEDGFTRANTAASPEQSGNTVAEDADDFEATGFRLGTFDATASLEQAFGKSSNIGNSVNDESGDFSQTDITLGLTSDWSRHQLQTDISGSYEKPFDEDEIDQPTLLANTALRLDLIDGMTLTTSGFYNLQTQGFTSTTLAPGAVDNPILQRFGGSVELQRDDRKLQYTLRGSIERALFADADLGGGLTFSQEDRNNTDYGISARLGYEISPAITPFLEAAYTNRQFDLTTDRNGNRRDSDIYELRSGLEIDLTDKLQGEIAAGFLSEQFEDAALEDLDGLSLEAELNWSPERETQIGVTLGTQTNSSISANENGSIFYTGRVDYERQINARLSANAFVGLELETNDNENRTTEFGVGIEYWVNRFMALTTDIEYNKFTSNASGSDFDELSGRFGVRLQR